MGKIIMIGEMKGGVGKSFTAFNLAYSLQKREKKVLAVDLDPQSNLTTCFGAEDVDVSIGDLMMNVIEDEELPERDEYIWERNGVDFIPSSIGLSAVEAKLRLEMGAEKMLAAILKQLKDDYDIILIDTSPALGALNINAMAALRFAPPNGHWSVSEWPHCGIERPVRKALFHGALDMSLHRI